MFQSEEAERNFLKGNLMSDSFSCLISFDFSQFLSTSLTSYLHHFNSRSLQKKKRKKHTRHIEKKRGKKTELIEDKF